MFKHLRGDLFGGLTAGIVALPLALAFGVSSGLGPSAGLYGAIFISFFAALFGGTPTQISGPTAPMTAVSMLVIAGMIANFDGQVEKALPAILTVFLLAGLLQIGLGFLGIGKYIKYIPYPVVSGFMTAIGVIILITQMLPAMGYYPKEDKSFVSEFTEDARSSLLQNELSREAKEDGLERRDLVQFAQEAPDVEIEKEAKNLAGRASSGVLGTLKILPQAFGNINRMELLLALLVFAQGHLPLLLAVITELQSAMATTALHLQFTTLRLL